MCGHIFPTVTTHFLFRKCLNPLDIIVIGAHKHISYLKWTSKEKVEHLRVHEKGADLMVYSFFNGLLFS